MFQFFFISISKNKIILKVLCFIIREILSENIFRVRFYNIHQPCVWHQKLKAPTPIFMAPFDISTLIVNVINGTNENKHLQLFSAYGTVECK